MINYLKVKNHKGIQEVTLDNLGQINIICGKNNSGKTSILEAITETAKRSIGKKLKIEDMDWIVSLLSSQFDRYTDPHPKYGREWFIRYIKTQIDGNTIWYDDDQEKIVTALQTDSQKDHVLGRYGRDVYIYIDFLNSFFKKTVDYFKPILIPPKRYLETIKKIDLQEKVSPTGEGLINRLFFLKNQFIESPEFKTYEKISKAFNKITGYNFNITPNTINQLALFFENEEKKWIGADACGMGLSDILAIISFSLDFEYTFLLIEEPESHLHPEMQKKLLTFLKTIKSRQFILSTHSSIFLDPYTVDKIYYCNFNNKVELTDETSKSEILFNLGYSVSDNFVSDVIVLTEGPSDIPIISTICQWMGFGDKFNIKYWPLGGDIMSELDLSVFAEKNKVIALIDNDPGSGVIRTRFETNCKEHQIWCLRLERYSIENYFTLDALKTFYQQDFPEGLTEIKYDQSLDVQMGFVKDGQKIRTVKSHNHQIIKLMSLSDIENTDLHAFCLKIGEICEQRSV